MHKLIIAHRGESYLAPENTLAAINLAWANGAEAVEIDIHLTKDNKIVVIHDYNTLRLTGVKMVIKESTLEELQSLDIGSYKASKWIGETIPTLTEVLKTVPSHGRIVIEIKSSIDILPILQKELQASSLAKSQIEIIAFNFETIAKAKQLIPNYKMLWLLNLDYYWPNWLLFFNTKYIINRVKRHKLDGVNVWAGKLITKRFIYKFAKAQLLVYCWTVNEPNKAKTLFENGINALTTDRASWMTEQLKH